jgi:hypothetical protein
MTGFVLVLQAWNQKNQIESKPSQTGKKPSQTGKTEPNWFEPVFVLKKPNRTKTGQFEPVSVFFLNISFGYFFFL